jgi:DNA processing protein
LNTAGHAATLGRPLGAVPGPVTSGSSAGCHRLLREFDARCVTTSDEAAELLGLDAAHDARPQEGDDDRTGERTRVSDALSVRSWRTVDDVARRSGMDPAHVRAHLGVMALEGTVANEGMRWRRVVVGAAG